MNASPVARGKPQVTAYGLVGYRRLDPNASRLIRNDKVRRRVAALRKEAERMARRTKEQLLAQWEERELKAEKAGKDALAHKISYDFANLMGWITTKTEVTNKTDNTKENAVRLARLSPEERTLWDRLCAKISEDLTPEEMERAA